MKKISLILLILLFWPMMVWAADAPDADTRTAPATSSVPQKRSTIWIDPKDHYFDMSDFIINMHGFVPVPIIITEPAVGGFGAGVAPVFIRPNKPIEHNGKMYPVMPDMTVVGAAYTANQSWLGTAGQIGVIEKYGLHYKVVGAAGKANLDFYQHLPQFNKDLKLELSMKMLPVYLYLAKQLPDPRFTIGIDYLFMDVDVSPQKINTNIPDNWIKDFNSIMSNAGMLFEFDNRDNIFTPNKGIKASLHGRISSKSIGSDFNYQSLEEAVYWYYPITSSWVSGLRFDAQQIFGNPPFYAKPYVDMRAVPSERYQGDNTALAELEQRFDFGATNRWSAVGFGGLGKAFDTAGDFGNSKWVYSYGIGGRYLLAEKLKLRIGIDIAKGRDGYAWYIVFGTSWMRQ